MTQSKFLPTALISLNLLLLNEIVLAANTCCSFSGNKSETRKLNSPNALYSISYSSGPSKKKQSAEDRFFNHQLSFVSKGKTTVLIRSDLGNADVLWAPDSNAFVVNNKAGTNFASSTLYKVNDLSHPIDILDALPSVGKRDLPKFQCDHNYTSATQWLDKKTLEVRFAGHDAKTASFTLIYHWNISSGHFKLIRRLSSEEWGLEVPCETQ